MDVKEYVGKCKERLLAGLQYNLEQSAMGAASSLDTFSMRWTLDLLREPSELESFIAGIPGFLGSATTTADPTPSSITLYSLLHAPDIQLGHRIGHLLKAQLPTSIACVDALWHITRCHTRGDWWAVKIPWDQQRGGIFT